MASDNDRRLNASYSDVVMLYRGPFASALLLSLSIIPAAFAAQMNECSQNARTFSPCELTFPLTNADIQNGIDPFANDTLHVEFRSPRAITYLIRSFAGSSRSLRVRFTPTEPGHWTYRVTSDLKTYDGKEGSFEVVETTAPGFVGVANVRHWWTTNKQPHLWLGAGVPFLKVDQTTYEAFLDARKHDGVTHIRGTVLSSGTPKPLNATGTPNDVYFTELDERVLGAIEKGFTVDLLLADAGFVRTGALAEYQSRERWVRYIVARYGGLNVTWEGIEAFEDVAGSRELLKDLGTLLKNYDAFQHPRSTDARVSAWPLANDGWLNAITEASPHPEVAAVEHQFTAAPEVHVIHAVDPDEFRHELWNCTTNGEYPSVSFESFQNQANARAVRAWSTVMADTRHWELEPYFDVDGARALGLEEVEYLAYAQNPAIVEITLPKHKYNPEWVNPVSGEEIPLKDYKGEVFSRPTPDNTHDWLLQVPREGHKESMLRSYRFESQDAPIQEIESDAAKIPFEVVEPEGDTLNARAPAPFRIKLTKTNRATRNMQIVWWGEVVSSGEGARLLGTGAKGTLTIPPNFSKGSDPTLNLHVMAINANGKAYELLKSYRLTP